MIVLMEPPLTIEDAKHLMEVLIDDIPYWNKKNIAFLLLIFASNPDLIVNGEEAVGYSPRSYQKDYATWDDYCGYGC